jgi:two-component system, chemotaxis family, protein-glutamate methylesterase/glutaminase
MMKDKLRVLVVDDSAYIRKVFQEMLNRNPLIEVVGAARDGLDALEQTELLNPDVVLLDIFMPVMDGVGFLEAQMARRRIPIVLVSSAGEDENKVLEAMDLGAVEFIQKPTARSSDLVFSIETELVDKILAAGQAAVENISIGIPVVEEGGVHLPAPHSETTVKVGAILMGLSTGGPQALRYLLPKIPIDFPAPIAIVLHMPVGYTGPFAERLNYLSKIEVLEAKEGMEMRPGRAVLAKAGFDLLLKRTSPGTVICHLDNYSSQESYHRPTVNQLFRSGALIYKEEALAIVLTGMGDDGLDGASWIKAEGGRVFTEAEESCVVYGMPRAVAEAGLSDRIVPLEKITEAIMETAHEDSDN